MSCTTVPVLGRISSASRPARGGDSSVPGRPGTGSGLASTRPGHRHIPRCPARQCFRGQALAPFQLQTPLVTGPAFHSFQHILCTPVLRGFSHYFAQDCNRRPAFSRLQQSLSEEGLVLRGAFDLHNLFQPLHRRLRVTLVRASWSSSLTVLSRYGRASSKRCAIVKFTARDRSTSTSSGRSRRIQRYRVFAASALPESSSSCARSRRGSPPPHPVIPATPITTTTVRPLISRIVNRRSTTPDALPLR